MIIYNESKRGGRSQHFWDFRIRRRRKERKISPLFPPFLSHSYSITCWPKSPWEKDDLLFWTPIRGESKGALLHASLKSILLHTCDESASPVAGSLSCPFVLNLTLRTYYSCKLVICRNKKQTVLTVVGGWSYRRVLSRRVWALVCIRCLAFHSFQWMTALMWMLLHNFLCGRRDELYQKKAPL